MLTPIKPPDDKFISLHYETDEKGNLVLVDQDGRKLAGVQRLTVDTDIEDADRATVHLLMHDQDGKPYRGGSR